MKESQYLIEKMSVTGCRVTVKAESGFTDKFLKADFFVEYQDELVIALSDEVLLAPFLYNVAPIIWLSGETYKLKTCDSQLYQSLLDVHEVMAAQYPLLEWAGRIEVDQLIDLGQVSCKFNLPNSVAVLFSGGLDSISTSLRHKDKSQLLLAVHGADVALGNVDGWEQVKNANDLYAKKMGYETGYIKANVIDFINTERLLHPEAGIFNWWGCVQHGMGLCGLALPIIIHRNIGTLFIGSSFTAAFSKPWGSSPDIDDKLALGNFRCSHDAFEWTRQDKLSFVVRSQMGADEKTELRVCHARPGFGGGQNCGSCEKCLRTMCGLVVEGAELKSWGFNTSPGIMGRRIRTAVETCTLKFGEVPCFFWKDIQSKAINSPNELIKKDVGFYQWFINVDFDKYFELYQAKPAVKLGYFKRKILPLVKRLISSNKYAKKITVYILNRSS